MGRTDPRAMSTTGRTREPGFDTTFWIASVVVSRKPEFNFVREFGMALCPVLRIRCGLVRPEKASQEAMMIATLNI